MYLLKIIRAAITFILVLLGILADVNKTDAKGDAPGAADGAKNEGENGEQDAKEAKSTEEKGEPDKPSGCQGGEPVDIVLGCVFFDFIDFEYPGAIPFSWERS
jgi:hypothetical protein